MIYKRKLNSYNLAIFTNLLTFFLLLFFNLKLLVIAFLLLCFCWCHKWFFNCNLCTDFMCYQFMCQGMFLGKNYKWTEKENETLYQKSKIDKKYKFFNKRFFICEWRKFVVWATRRESRHVNVWRNLHGRFPRPQRGLIRKTPFVIVCMCILAKEWNKF